MVDIHSHILFALDDGARTAKESGEMLRQARAAGVTEIVATPHVYKPGFDWTHARAQLARLQKLTPIRLRLGSEVHINLLAHTGLSHAPDYCVEGTRALLIEFDPYALPPKLDRVVLTLQSLGTVVRIAHPERYIPVQTDLEIAQTLFNMGCELQISAGSLLSSVPMPAAGACAKKLLKKGLVKWIASDAHRPDDYAVFQKAYAKWSSYLC